MRRFTFKADLRKPKDSTLSAVPLPQGPKGDGLQLSESLGRQRKNLRHWPDYQRALRALPLVTQAADFFEDRDLAEEYVRIYGVTRDKIMQAAPGFDTEGKTEIHCFFEDDGSKHLVSRLIARPNARVTELSLHPSGEITRLYYENGGGPDQDLDQLYESGISGLEEDTSRFAANPHYHLKFVSLPCDHGTLTDIYKGVCYYDSSTGTVATEEEGE